MPKIVFLDIDHAEIEFFDQPEFHAIVDNPNIRFDYEYVAETVLPLDYYDNPWMNSTAVPAF